jgi:hypothetical protein
MPEVFSRRTRVPPQKQQRFPHRTVAVQPRTVALKHATAAERRKKQATLTQIDFVSTPPVSGGDWRDQDDEDDEIKDDEDEDEDSQDVPRSLKNFEDDDSDDFDFDQPPPSRKRVKRGPSEHVKPQASKTAKGKVKASAQSTLTQVWDGSTPALISKPGIISDSDDDMEVEVTSTPASRTPVQAVFHPRKVSPQLVKQTQHVAPSLSKGAEVKVEHQENLDFHVVRPTSAMVYVVPRTPRAARWEVPSSQTPASIKLSAENSPRIRAALNCSPLGKHISLPQQDEVVQATYLGEVDLPPSPSNLAKKFKYAQVEAAVLQTSTQSPSRQLEQEGSPTPRKPTLKHISTVEDSDEELEVSGPSRTADQDQLQSALEESIRLHHYTQFEPSNAFTQYPQTYDPVSAALNRDAARFEDETQTQSPANLTGVSTPNRTPHRTQSQTNRTSLVKVLSMMQSSSPSLIPSSPDIRLRNASDSSLPIIISSSAPPIPESDDATLTIPESPRVIGAGTPRIPTSQMSTVVPSSPAGFLARLNSAQQSPSREDLLEETPHWRRNTSKPAQPADVVFSSSPIPLPPWSEDEMQAGVQRRDPILDGDESFDESLPPLPPGWSFARDGGSG